MHYPVISLVYVYIYSHTSQSCTLYTSPVRCEFRCKYPVSYLVIDDVKFLFFIADLHVLLFALCLFAW